jgi:hypothetical protein
MAIAFYLFLRAGGRTSVGSSDCSWPGLGTTDNLGLLIVKRLVSAIDFLSGNIFCSECVVLRFIWGPPSSVGLKSSQASSAEARKKSSPSPH